MFAHGQFDEEEADRARVSLWPFVAACHLPLLEIFCQSGGSHGHVVVGHARCQCTRLSSPSLHRPALQAPTDVIYQSINCPTGRFWWISPPPVVVVEPSNNNHRGILRELAARESAAYGALFYKLARAAASTSCSERIKKATCVSSPPDPCVLLTLSASLLASSSLLSSSLPTFHRSSLYLLAWGPIPTGSFPLGLSTREHSETGNRLCNVRSDKVMYATLTV